MNKKRYVLQDDFDNIPNGYHQWSDGWDYTQVNRGLSGLYRRVWPDELTYYIR